MKKTIIVCLLMMGILGTAATAFQAEAPQGVPPQACNPAGSVSTTGSEVPLASTNCGSYTCSNNGQCCGANTCCPSNMNLYCRSNNTCYNTTSGAQAACGNSYTICSKPAN